jgi:hypothetical protein
MADPDFDALNPYLLLPDIADILADIADSSASIPSMPH